MICNGLFFNVFKLTKIVEEQIYVEYNIIKMSVYLNFKIEIDYYTN